MVHISELDAGNWPLLKQIRVLSVGDSPDAFGTTISEVNVQSDSYWADLARYLDRKLQTLFVATDDDEVPIGSMYVRVGDDMVGHVGSMWVAPLHRGKGLGRELLERGLGWLEARGVSTVQLWVTDGNDIAFGLYRASGFKATGARAKLREGSELDRIQMERRLDA